MLKAEMASLVPVKPSKNSLSTTVATPATPATDNSVEPAPAPSATFPSGDELEIPGLGGMSSTPSAGAVETSTPSEPMHVENDAAPKANGEAEPPVVEAEDVVMDGTTARGRKRSIHEVEAEDANVDADGDATVDIGDDDDDPAPTNTSMKLKVNPDGTVEQEDIVKCVWSLCVTLYGVNLSNFRLWEPGYRERYYRQKFGVEYDDKAFRKE